MGERATWQDYRDAAVRFLRNRSKRYRQSGNDAADHVAQDLDDIADALTSQTQFPAPGERADTETD